MYFLFLLVATNIVFGQKCLKLKNDGEKCFYDNECLSDWCNNKVCKSLPDYGKLCTSDLRCKESFGCSAKVEGMCEEISQRGELCQYSKTGKNVCAPGLLCYKGTCLKPKPLYSECSDDRQCEFDQKCSFNWIKLKSICLPKQGKWNFCLNNSGCKSGFFCNRLYMCKELKKLGESCTFNYECAKEFDCRENISFTNQFYKKRMCKKIPFENESCSEKCYFGYYCGLDYTVKEPNALQKIFDTIRQSAV
jgi:hypothetical protein